MGVAQLGERTVRIRKVESSILFVSTITHTYEHQPIKIVVWRNVFAVELTAEWKKHPEGIAAPWVLFCIVHSFTNYVFITFSRAYAYMGTFRRLEDIIPLYTAYFTLYDKKCKNVRKATKAV